MAKPETKPKYSKSLSHERVEHISDIIGSWGPLQKRLFLFLGIIYCVAPYNNASLFFYAIKSDIVCVESDDSETSIEADQCTFDELDSCASWYHNVTRTTITKEWDLVCERYWLRSVVLSSYQFGYLVSGLIVGYISDRHGRKLAILFCILLEIVCSLGLILSPNVYVFIAIRVFHGIGGYGRYLASVILLMESVGPNLRGRILICYEWVWFLGEYVMMFVTYHVPKFKYIYMGSMIFQLLCIGIVTILPESARWQLVVGQIDRAEETLRLYAKKRKSKGAESDTETANKDDEQKELFDLKLDKLRGHLYSGERPTTFRGLFYLIRQPRISRFCFALYVIWFLRTFIGWGLIYSTLDLSGNVFINNAIILTASVLANLFMTWKIDSFRRRSMLITFFLMTSVLLCASIAFVESHQYIIPRMILIASGKFFSTAIYSLVYVYTSEIFPTNIRHLGVGTCSMVSRIASISVPFLAQLTAATSLKLTFGIFAAMGIVGALAATLLPETKGKEIPDTIEGMVEIHAINKP
ncbi:organic cation transporter protein [Tetranychus urticae]|uniref:Major facilitator superfamily (MFS) profile domain-containing protein n=1 Tax=Tetranychus urticae TaxID=32264 RepID=T1KG73_TETUR|nr:organic cation transporter protein [Tetranychus urticae]